MYGPTIDGKVVVREMGGTVLKYPQVKQYLRYWKTRTRAGVWADKADIDGHAANCMRAKKANPNTVPSVSYKEMNGRRVTRDLGHKRNRSYNPPELATEKSLSADNVDACMSAEDDEVADAISQLLHHEGVKGTSEVMAEGGPIDAQALSTLVMDMSEGLVEIPCTDIGAST